MATHVAPTVGECVKAVKPCCEPSAHVVATPLLILSEQRKVPAATKTRSPAAEMAGEDEAWLAAAAIWYVHATLLLGPIATTVPLCAT